MDTIAANIWIAACAHHLQKHWRTVDPVQLEEVAKELLKNTQLQLLEPADAAALWLRPVVSSRMAVSGALERRELPAQPWKQRVGAAALLLRTRSATA